MSTPEKQETGQEGKSVKARATCTHHAACCNRHFHSLAAFDAHHTEDGCDENAVNSNGKPLLEVWTRDGWCMLQDRAPKEGFHPVTIWTTAGLEQRRAALSNL